MLPYSVLQSDVSPVDLASLAKRLNAIAKTTSRCEDKKTLKGATSPLSSQHEFSTVWGSPCRSPARVGMAEQIGVAYGGRSPSRLKPILDTIREKSFNRRESDLHENNWCLQGLLCIEVTTKGRWRHVFGGVIKLFLFETIVLFFWSFYCIRGMDRAIILVKIPVCLILLCCTYESS